MLRVLTVVGGIVLFATQAQVAATADDPAVDRFDACQKMIRWIGADGIRFRASSAVLSGTSLPVLDRLAELAHDCAAVRIAITGHTDGLGSPEFNQQLGERRASAVADYLESRGVEEERLIVRGAGASQPVADNETAYGRERNRRIEFELLRPTDDTAAAP